MRLIGAQTDPRIVEELRRQQMDTVISALGMEEAAALAYVRRQLEYIHSGQFLAEVLSAGDVLWWDRAFPRDANNSETSASVAKCATNDAIQFNSPAEPSSGDDGSKGLRAALDEPSPLSTPMGQVLDLREYIKAMRWGPGKASVVDSIPDEYWLHDNLDGAISRLTEAITQDGKNLVAYYYRAITYLLKSDTIKALEDTAAALKIDPREVRVILLQSNIAWMYNHFDHVYGLLAKAIKIDPKAFEPYEKRAMLNAQLKNYDGAKSDLDEAIKLNPGGVEAYVTRSEIRSVTGDHKGAISDLTTALNLVGAQARGRPNLLERRGEAFFSQRSYEAAIDDLTAAIELDPTNRLYHQRGLCKFKLKRFQEALEDYTSAVSTEPNARTVTARAVVYACLGEVDQAIADFTEAIRLEPRNSRLYVHRGLASEAFGRRDRAVADLEQALRLNPQEQEAEKVLKRLQGAKEG